jgi:prepilin-type N-terminal cleavage/methylation domain-containing protein
MHDMLSARRGFTLAEVIVALVLTSIIGAAVTGVFITQSRFFDRQEKVGSARGVSRGALNMIMSELRMLERDNAIVSATAKRLTLRAPYAMAVACDNGSGFHIRQIPGDTVMWREAGHSGYAYLNSDGTYTYVATQQAPVAGGSTGASACLAAGVPAAPADSGWRTLRLGPATPTTVSIGAPVLLYQLITYEFKDSHAVPGRIGLWRFIHARDLDEELVAPFDTTAGFGFYPDDTGQVQQTVPSPTSSITGIKLTLDGLSQRPDPDGSHQQVPLTTSVFFRNRR